MKELMITNRSFSVVLCGIKCPIICVSFRDAQFNKVVESACVLQLISAEFALVQRINQLMDQIKVIAKERGEFAKVMREEFCKIISAEIYKDRYNALQHILMLLECLNACLQCSLGFIFKPIPSNSDDFSSVNEVIGNLCKEAATPTHHFVALRKKSRLESIQHQTQSVSRKIERMLMLNQLSQMP